MDSKPLVLYDRSRVTTDWQCPRKRYWQYEYEGRGVVSSNTHLELFMGTTIHDGLAAIAAFQDEGVKVPIDTIAEAAHKQMVEALLAETTGEVDEINFAEEQAALVEGLLRGFYKHVWSRLIKSYPVIKCIEREMTYEHNGMVFMSRPDLVVADSDGNNWYIEYKSTSSKKDGWVNSWTTAVQLHSTIRAIEATIGEKVTGVIVQGLYKGYESYGKQNSPFCYAYHRQGSPPFTKTETIYEYRAGFKRIPTWNLEGGVKKWVDGMSEEMLTEQFPQTPPIFVKDDLIDAFFAQRAVREREIDLALQMMEFAPEAQYELLNTSFPQKFDQCYPYFGKPCSYVRMCHGNVRDPLSNGFEWRQGHHQLEVEQDEEKATVKEVPEAREA